MSERPMRKYRDKIMNLPMPLRVMTISGLAVAGLCIAAALALVFGLVLMYLWNWLMPEIFGLPAITFWQAWGLVVISHILFKSGPLCEHTDHREPTWKRRLREKYREPGCHPEADSEAAEEEKEEK